MSGAVISERASACLQLQLASEIGPIRFRRLVEHFGSVDAAVSASRRELERVAGIGPRIAESIFRSRSDGAVDREIERAAACGVRILCLEDADYPRLLLNIPDPPICLYVRGQMATTDGVALAIVGTRRCSHYGREQAARFGEMLAGAGFTVVSGLARGIDGQAHQGALRGGGRTIAVLGNGLATVYPTEHAALAEQIIAAGALVTEVPLDAQPSPENFPRRNRIIAGLSLGVLVIEAGITSGALITARLATEYNREVFALPGQVDKPQFSAGVNALIRDGGAKLVTCLEDVLDELAEVGEIMGRNLSPAAAGDEPRSAGRAVAQLDGDARAVHEAVSGGVEDLDEIVSQTGLGAAGVMSALTALQLKGLVRQLPGNRFVPA